MHNGHHSNDNIEPHLIQIYRTTESPPNTRYKMSVKSSLSRFCIFVKWLYFIDSS